MRQAAIVGAGLIGRSWAHVFVRGGWQVRIWDPDPAQRERAAQLVGQSLRDLARHGLVADPEHAMRGLLVADSLAEAVMDADYVQESGPETLEAKQSAFAQLDAAAPISAVLASSTSAIVASRFTENLAGRSRCIVAHPVNPPHLIPVVELCGAPWTSDQTRRQAREILVSIGQSPVDVKREVDGFILNRLQAALLGEAFRLVQEGFVDAHDLDRTIADGLGLRWAFMGPFETIELNAPGGITDYCRRYVDWFRRYASDPAPVSVWDDAAWERVAASWVPALSSDEIAAKSVWRDERLAALLAHKRGQPPSDS